MSIQFADYCFGVLTATLTNISTSMQVTLGSGSHAPPTLGVGDYFYASLVDAASNTAATVPPIKYEVVKVTNVAGPVWTIVRGSPASAFSVGDSVTIRANASSLYDLKDINGPIGPTGAVGPTGPSVTGPSVTGPTGPSVTGPTGPLGPSVTGPSVTGPTGPTAPAYIFDGGLPSTTYVTGPAFDCGGVS